MKKGIKIIGSLILIGAIGAGAWYYLYGRNVTDEDAEVAYVTKISALNGDDAGILNRFAGVVEPQKTVTVNIENGRVVNEIKVQTGDVVKAGQLLFEYDLSSIEDSLQEANLALDRLKNEAMSLNEQIATLEKEKAKASRDNQLSYTIEIETNKMNLKKNEYDQQTKTAEIEKLQNATGNTEVRSEIDGIIQKIDTSKMNTNTGDYLDEGGESYYGSDDSNSNAFITILSTGSYRIKGQINEQNKNSLAAGESMIIRSRVDSTQIWHGTMGTIDEQNASSGNSDGGMYGMIDSSGDSQTNSSTYPFYVELESSDGLMLGQHVYIEKDEGQEDAKAGLWINEFYIVDADTDAPYVWAANDQKKLEKRSVILGQYDEDLSEYEIVEGLTENDSIAFPTENLKEGMTTVEGDKWGESGIDAGIIDDMDDYSDEDIDSDTEDYEYSEDDDMELLDGDNADLSEDDWTDEEIVEDMDEFGDTGSDDVEFIEEPIQYDSDDTEAAG